MPVEIIGATPESWQEPERLRWSFSHFEEVLPTRRIASSSSPTTLDPAYAELPIDQIAGPSFLEDTWTDAFVVLHRGQVVHESYHGFMDPRRRHLLMSASKSVVGVMAGSLVESGVLPESTRCSAVIPQLGEGGYRDATVRDLLDMRCGVDFQEDYVAADSGAVQMEQACGWRPASAETPPSLRSFLMTVGPRGRHGGAFTYRSSDTDVLAWMCEAASGASLAELVGELVWVPLGAEDAAALSVDRAGHGVADGGLCATARDTARFGELLRRGGTSSTGRVVVSERWINDAVRGAESSARAFAESSLSDSFSHYRSQLWIMDPEIVCLGIHGQLVFVDPSRQVTIVKLSSWPHAQNGRVLRGTLAVARSIARHLG